MHVWVMNKNETGAVGVPGTDNSSVQLDYEGGLPLGFGLRRQAQAATPCQEHWDALEEACLSDHSRMEKNRQ